ncbi:MAG: glycosyltransferase [Planctomycetota bacterium]
MRFALVSSHEPFAGSSDTVGALARTLVAHGHDVETILLPACPGPEGLLDQMVAYRFFDFGDSIDRVIALRPPAHVVRHRHKIVWLVDPPADDEDDGRLAPDALARRDEQLRLDGESLREARAIYAPSAEIADRLARRHGVASTVLHPPLADASPYRAGPCGDELVCIAPLEPDQRHALLLEALGHVRTGARLVIAGKSRSRGYPGQLRRLAAERGLGDRVEIVERPIGVDEQAALVGSCRAVVSLPFTASGCAAAALAAGHAGKAVLTTCDSGAVAELVADGVNGLVCEPTAKALAAALERLLGDRRLAADLGARGPARIRALGIGWEGVVGRLAA